MEKPILFKKYANRRLYNTTTSKQAAIPELLELIRAGHHVQVVEAKTGEDVTAFTLTQIILEQAKTKNALLPPSFLHLIIRYGDNLLIDFFETYLNPILKNYLTYKHATDDQFKSWLELGANLSQSAWDSNAAMAAMQKWLCGFQPQPKDKR